MRGTSRSTRSTLWQINEAPMPKMLILRGNSGSSYVDESGKPRKYERGALHEQAALDYASRKGYQGTVLDISGDPGTGTPQSKLVRETLKSLRPPSTKRITSLRRLSGWMKPGLAAYKSSKSC